MVIIFCPYLSTAKIANVSMLQYFLMTDINNKHCIIKSANDKNENNLLLLTAITTLSYHTLVL